MVRAILGDKKSQTRRIVKDPVHWVKSDPRGQVAFIGNCVSMVEALSPYGRVGDHLWVKETFAPIHLWRCEPKFAAATVDYIYRADYERDPDRIVRPHHWKPSIFCTRAASRLTLEIVSVRCERLQDISEADAVAEGVTPVRSPDMLSIFTTKGYACDITHDHIHGVPKVGDEWMGHKVTNVVPNPGSLLDTARNSYRKLWRDINGPDSWELNPWVWVIEFRRVEKGAAT